MKVNRTSVLNAAFAQLDDVDKEKHWLQARYANLQEWVDANIMNPSQVGRLQLSLNEMAEITQQLVALDWMIADTSVEAA